MSETATIPADLEAEEAVLGSILIEPTCITRVNGRLKAADFYREKNRWVYEAMLAMAEREEAINQITLAAELANRDRLEVAGGAAYLSYLISQLPTAVHVEHYANLVMRHSRARALIVAAEHIRDLGYEDPTDIEAAVADAHERLMQVAGSTEREYRSAYQILRQESSPLLETGRAPEIAGLRTGFQDLDAVLNGLDPGRLYVLFGQTSMGKSQLALTIAANLLTNETPVAVASLEMTADESVGRLVDREANVDRYRMRKGEISWSEEIQTSLMEAAGVISEWPLYIDDTRGLSVMQIRARIARLQVQHRIALVIVDHLGRVNERAESETIAYAKAVKGLHAMAGALRVPVLLLAQPNRAMEARADKRPTLSDLRQTGEIEQTADVVLGIYVADYYRVRGQPIAGANGVPTTERDFQMELHVLKNRQGPVGVVHLICDITRGLITSRPRL